MTSKIKNITSQLGGFAGIIEKFVDDNIIEKAQREQNLRKISLKLESLVKTHFNFPSEVQVKIKKLENFKGELPSYQSVLASGMDVRAQLREELTLSPGERTLIPTGLSVAIPKGYEIQARPRSGWAIREGITLLNTPGTIDADYRGEIKIILANLGQESVTIQDQDRVAQLVICPVVQAQWVECVELDDTERGTGGFGSTGKRES